MVRLYDVNSFLSTFMADVALVIKDRDRLTISRLTAAMHAERGRIEFSRLI